MRFLGCSRRMAIVSRTACARNGMLISPHTPFIRSENALAKPNYQFEKRQRDLAKKKKQDEKRERKQAKVADATGDTVQGNPDDASAK